MDELQKCLLPVTEFNYKATLVNEIVVNFVV